MAHPMDLSLTPDEVQRHTAAARVSRIAKYLTNLVSTIQDIQDISSSAEASLHDVVRDFSLAHDRHARRVDRMFTLTLPSSYKVFNMGRAAASSAQRSLFYAHERLLIHQQALRVQTDRVERLMVMLKRYHKFTKTSAYLMEEALDLSADVHASSTRSRQASMLEVPKDHPGSSDEFEDDSEDSDDSVTFGTELGLDDGTNSCSQ
jgi:hypothetical protein